MLSHDAIDRKSKIDNRIWELDFIRGVCIILMVMDHLFYSLSYIFSEAWLASGNDWAIKTIQFAQRYFTSDLRASIRPLVLWAFFLICGISSSFSRSNIKRGIQLVVVALVITLGTQLIEQHLNFSNIVIRFGVIHMLAVSILVWSMIDLILRDRYKTAVACFGLGIALIILNINFDYFFKDIVVDNNNYAFIHTSLLTSRQGVYSADYFPLLPHMAKFMIGAALGPILYKNKKTLMPFLDYFRWYRPINFLGRNTLIIFILHQPIITSLIALISAWLITNGDYIIFQ